MSNKRFGPALGAVLLVTGASSAAVAQDTLQVQPQPQRHVVQLGETLWGIAQLYLGDPLLWPEIYRINTTVVEDPHWIFPGEELLLAPADQTAVAITEPEPGAQAPEQGPEEELELPAETPPPAPPSSAPEGRTVFARWAGGDTGPTLGAGPADAYRALRPGEFYAAGFLTEEQPFPWAVVRAKADPAGVRALTGRTAMLGQAIWIEAPAGANYQVGDSLVTYRLPREVGDGWGQIVHPTGIVRVLHVAGRDVLGEVMSQFDQVRPEQLALPVEPFPDPGTARPQPVTDGVLGSVVTLRALREVPKQYDALFIDLGRNAGIVPGDVLEVLPRPEDVEVAERPGDAVARLKVVHVRDRSATALLTGIFTPGVRATLRRGAGAPVRLIQKMPS